MAVDRRGRRTAFDNIAIGSATGAERTIAGGGGENTTQYNGKEENYRSVCDSSWTSEKTIEHFTRSVSGGATTDQANG
jgi:hypothetical protein